MFSLWIPLYSNCRKTMLLNMKIGSSLWWYETHCKCISCTVLHDKIFVKTHDCTSLWFSVPSIQPEENGNKHFPIGIPLGAVAEAQTHLHPHLRGSLFRLFCSNAIEDCRLCEDRTEIPRNQFTLGCVIVRRVNVLIWCSLIFVSQGVLCPNAKCKTALMQNR